MTRARSTTSSTTREVDWRIYYGDFPQSLLMVHQLDKLDHYRKFDRWAADVQAGDLPAYVFIEP